MSRRQTEERGRESGGSAALLQELHQRLAGWRPQFIGTLMFIRDGHRVLLIRKKRGLGAGRINAPGGKVEAGESPLACAVRETREEIGVTVLHAALMAELRFVERVDQQWYGYAFVASDYDGMPTETVEATPHWFAADHIPYDEMWEDDRLWLPHVLAGRF
ncbi:MAG: 8-oxo-dGTP diphosphatase, partial [Gammaproteobacteria bacterium]|nr:8-oxo-dGTP diphosphatase [Gammaproteobacteria bacterium]